MLQLKQISKQYITGDLVQNALNNVSMNLRDNEFVAILGPSGSGKTTLLNIIGGLDRYDSGDLIINNISTKKYKERDWDSYRNHTIGFVFQSYNLIPHQSILANVELALTISGISKSERRKRAKHALEQVGLGDQFHKKPNQMSGGQMQRVAIARALVNDPDILLADEPTGALDTETSVQVMDLLKEVAKDRLVVMVTHNPELAEEYANRIIKLRDGKIIDDSNPYELDTEEVPVKYENMGKSSMSFLTSLSLSFNNLKTKKGRTLLTAFAGSIGIIGIALILSLSNGVNDYITDIQKSTMTSYPITIDAQSFDIASMMDIGQTSMESQFEGPLHELDGVYSDVVDLELASSMMSSITENNLTKFKEYLDNPDSEIHQYVGENGIVYSYNTKFNVFTYDPKNVLVNTDGSTFDNDKNTNQTMMMPMGVGMTTNHFEQLMPGTNDQLISSAVTDNYELLYGSWPESYDEVVLRLDHNNEISATTLYELGILPSSEYKQILKDINEGNELSLEAQKWSYEDIANKTFYFVPAADMYKEKDNGLFESIADDTAEIEKLLESALQLKISGIIRPKEGSDTLSINQEIGYTKALTDYVIDVTNNSKVVTAQVENQNINVLNGMEFAPADDKVKIENTKTYLLNLGISEKAKLCKEMLQAVYATNPEMANELFALSEAELAAMLDEYLKNPDDQVLLGIYNTYISTGSYDENLEAFGVVSLAAPSSINIYSDSFEAKDEISRSIEEYNKTVSEPDQIHYTDYVGLLMSSVTTIVDVISYVLIAFVSVSLIVSSIMIGIITYISVLERTKEIGILRAIGASKRNISQVFNAETFIIGLCSGAIGIGVTLLLLIPGNAVIHAVTETDNVSASLPFTSALFLIGLSMILTIIGGLIPAKKAAKKDPVTALRSE